MRKAKLVFFFFVTISSGVTHAQTTRKFTLSGASKDKSNGETLPGATVTVIEVPGVGVSSNSYGFFSLTLPEGKYTVLTSYTGFLTDTLRVELNKNVVHNVSLAGSENQLLEVTVKAPAKNSDILSSAVGVQKLTIEDIKNVPVLFGEKDVIKTIQLLPGIVSAGDGKPGFFVRGGASDQNLILLDEATVYNASHLLGFFSVFNSDAIKDIDIYKGGMPANYGGRLSSVEDIHMSDGNNQKFHVNGGLGLISSRLTVEGPLKRDKGSFMVSARRTYVDLFTKLLSDTTIKGSKLFFYDFNVKGNYQLSKKSRIFLSAYFGKDVMKLNTGEGIDYANATATLRLNHIFSSKLFSNTSLIFSNFTYNVHAMGGGFNIKVSSGIRDYHFKQNFNYYINRNNKLDFGFETNYHNTQPGQARSIASSSYNDITLERRFSLESAAYISHEWAASEKLKVTYGMRLSNLSILGEGTFKTYNQNGNIIESRYYSSGKLVKSYMIAEPRIAIGYKISESSSVKLSFDRNAQNIHLLNNAATTSPTSLYLPSSNNIKPEISDQISSGYYKTLGDGAYEMSTELYYKKLQNQIDYKNNANLVGNENLEADLLYGKGRAYGWETYFKKKSGKLTGWVSYTLSKTERKITGINNDKYYPAFQDQTHHLSVVGLYQASKKWTFSAVFIYNTGNAVTWPSGKFAVDGATVYTYNGRNGNRMPAYNRLDIGATLLKKKTARFESSWNFSIYNVYGMSNPFTISFQNDPVNENKTQVLQTTLFKMVPSVTYNFKF
jgi:hypothetical protein